MIRRKTKLLYLLLLPLMLLVFFVPAKADTGPKPSVWITLHGLPEGKVYAAIITPEDTFSLNKPDGIPEEIVEKIMAYEDPDGYTFNGFLREIGEDGEISWTYYAPDHFKLLLYAAKEDRFISSGICERYAYKSLYSVTVEGSGMEINSYLGKGGLILGFFARLAVTLAVEIVIALLFGLRSKEQLTVIILTNLVTQLALNLFLTKVGMPTNFIWYCIGFGLAELFVFALESVIYALRLRDETQTAGRLTFYAFVANLASMIMGFVFSNWFPMLF